MYRVTSYCDFEFLTIKKLTRRFLYSLGIFVQVFYLQRRFLIMGDQPVMFTAIFLVFIGWGLARYKYIIEIFKTNSFFDLGYEFLCVSFVAASFALIIGLIHNDEHRR